MVLRIHSIAAALAAGVFAAAPALADAADRGIDPRPQDTTKNLPSDTGSQTTQPSGAVTGAGQPQGTLPQPDEGKPGGVEERARAAEKATGTHGRTGSRKGADSGSAAGGSGTSPGGSGGSYDKR